MDKFVEAELRKWKLPHLIEIFKKHRINSENLFYLSHDHIDKLIPEIGDQCTFLKNREILEKETRDNSLNFHSLRGNSVLGGLESDSAQYKRFSLEKINHDNSSNFDSLFDGSIDGENANDSALFNFHQIKSPNTIIKEEILFVDPLAISESDISQTSKIGGENTNGSALFNFRQIESLNSKQEISAVSPPELLEQNNSQTNSVLRLLNSNFRGKVVLAYYESKKEILNNELSAIIIENEFDNSSDLSYKIHRDRFLQLRKEIKEIFPTALPESWYQPITRGSKGEKINCRGKLYNTYNEKRRILNDINFINKDPKKKSDTVLEVLFENDESTAALDFLKKNIEPENLILNAWKVTQQARLVYKDLSNCDYYSTFKCLQGSNGLTLLLNDFDATYGVNSGKFLLNWSTIAKKIIAISKKKANPRQNAELFEILEKHKKLIDEGKIEIIALIVLPYLLGSSYRKRKKKSSWIPTKQDVVDSFVLHIKTYKELTPYQDKKRDIYHDEKLTFQPYPVLCGALDQIHSSFVIINDIEYSVDSPLKAVDACFKSFFALNVNYPVESSSCWIFLQKFVFDIPVEREDSAVNKLITQLQ